MMPSLHVLLIAFAVMTEMGSVLSSSSSATVAAKLHRNETRKGRRLDDLPKRRPRIHGGWSTVEDRYSYAQVSLQWEGDHQCGGTLVAPDMVLTAAHCVESFDKIEIGKYNRYDVIDVSETFETVLEIMHPEYDEVTTRYDIMVVKLNGNSILATPVRINRNESIPSDGTILTVIGMGYNADWELPDTVEETAVEYDINDECDDIVDENGITLEGDLYPDMLCAGAIGRDSCYGDSGSPLVLKGETEETDVQIGLVSWGYECAGTLPGVYSRLSHWPIYSFIEQNVCLHSVEPPTYMNCDNWTLAPTITPTELPTKTPTRPPSATPTISPDPTQSMSPTITAAPSGIESPAPSTERLRQFLEGTASLPDSDLMLTTTTNDSIQPRISETSAASVVMPSSSATGAILVFFSATWACLL